MALPLLDVRHLDVFYHPPAGTLQAVSDLSLEIVRGEVFALVGETGCGKSTVALALLGLLERSAELRAERIIFDDREISKFGEREWRRFRGSRIGVVFQDARNSLNPVLKIEDHLVETIRAHRRLSGREARGRSLELLREAGISDPERCARSYPLELSGGMCQRVGIALALCNLPQLLVADEPTSSLDPTLQAQILSLLRDMNRRHNLAILLISHDLSLVSAFADRVAVMYHGRLLESAPVARIFEHPAHPYTRGLLQSRPGKEHDRNLRPLVPIPGTPPRPGLAMSGCCFAPRCSLAEPRCHREFPAPVPLTVDHWAACFLAEGGNQSAGKGT